MAGLQITHDEDIDWLELNQKGTHLLFRDRKCHLYLYNMATGERKRLLQYVGYVQWVPDSDVIVVRAPVLHFSRHQPAICCLSSPANSAHQSIFG
jgi:hypothetical protein